MIISQWLTAQIAISLIALLYATITDLRSNEVENFVWIFLGAGGLGVAAWAYGNTPMLLIHLLFGGLITVAALGIWYFFSDLVGAADVKAIMALGFCIPTLMLMVVGYTAVAGLGYIGFKYTKGTPRADLMKLKVPLMPILFLGAILAVLAYALA